MKHISPPRLAPMPPIRNQNRLKLGLFGMNCSGGLAASTVPERWRNGWENNVAVAQLADEAGLEFLLPIARWIGYGGTSGFHADVLDPMTWAAGLLAVTRRINVFTTAHTSIHHPVVVAKQIATLDQIGAGRVGLNVVVGWNRPEFAALGLPLDVDRVQRYAMAAEWLAIVRRLWHETAPFDWNGEFYKLSKVSGAPRPIACPVPIFNAAMSADGRDFAVRNSEFLFTASLDLRTAKTDIESMRTTAQSLDRSVGTLTFCHVVCRPSARDARDYHRYYAIQHADREAVETLVSSMMPHVATLPKATQEIIKFSFAAGHGSRALVGDPDMIADDLAAISAAGFDGTTLGFVDYRQELPYFLDEVLPRLERRGLRADRRL
ncbi:LLM class flavin-dependent oxidoreductase [Bradyrhizobium sp.]|uniref:LLM class flavin-dependent oxidoreductase n=1 Tax=Bradyrhizobium sp. TaxID=376 RepID=UPI003C27526D